MLLLHTRAVLLSVLLIGLVRAANIAIYVLPTHGHVNPIIPLGVELQKRGHHVSFTCFDNERYFVKDYGFDYISLGKESVVNQSTFVEINEFMSQHPYDTSGPLRSLNENILVVYGTVLNALSEQIQQSKVDLIITDQLGFPASDVAKKYNVPLVVLIHYLEVLTPFLPSAPHLPAYMSGKLFNPNPTYWEQLVNVFTTYITMAKMAPLLSTINAEKAKWGIHTDHDLRALMLVPSAWGYEIPRPITPNIHLIGNLWPVEDSTEAWNSDVGTWLSSSDVPVLYVSLGSMVVVTEAQLVELYEGLKIALQTTNIRVLWILRNNQKGRELVTRTPVENLRIEPWSDQRKILSHKNVFCFYSHGGQNSISESLSRGKPLIIMPFFGDQVSNAALVVYSNSGLRLLSEELTRHEAAKVIQQAYANRANFTKGAQEVAKLLKDAGGATRGVDLIEKAVSSIPHSQLMARHA